MEPIFLIQKCFLLATPILMNTDLMPHPDETEVIALKLTIYNRSSTVTEELTCT
ncbi:hypothetical protein [Chengkuizengella marina]|uniref:hypothetical protein n=1 Tax=Chengkuizengella marina TaxID=2507566 RepID=UPI001367D9F2|nr:hypothetical protein [Chengkuizengella marina]